MSILVALKSLFKRRPSNVESLSAIARLTYAIGDIHGRLDLFEKMLARIKADELCDGERPRLVLLGDYVDRGPKSREVLDRLIALREENWCDLEILLGNHEESMLKFMSEAAAGPAWAQYGGAATLASYGVSQPEARTDLSQWEITRQAFVAAVPESHLKLLREMKYVFQVDDYIFVHAGVRPDIPLVDQGPETFLWVRGAFLASRRACQYVVVHGHTPEDAPTNMQWRIGIDTGAYATGVLTAVKLIEDAREIIQVR